MARLHLPTSVCVCVCVTMISGMPCLLSLLTHHTLTTRALCFPQVCPTAPPTKRGSTPLEKR